LRRAHLVCVLPLIACAAFAQTPTIAAVTGVLAAASTPAAVANRVCPGDLAAVFGSNFGTSTSIQVTIGGKQAAVLFASNTQLNIEIPVDAPAGATTMTVGTSAPFNITLSQFAPLVSVQAGYVVALDAGTSKLLGPNAPAAPAETIELFASGLGPTNPVVPTGQQASGLAPTVNPVTVTVGGQPAKVIFAGASPGQVGLYQLNVQLPSTLGNGPQPLQLTVTPAGGGAAVSTDIVALPFATPPPPLTLFNNYSGIWPGLPNYGIAQGAIFDIYAASGLANASTPLQNPPLQATLNGVSVNVTVNGTTVHPFLYFVTPTQIAAILPSNTPAGDGTIAVVNNGTTVGPAPIRVVPSAFGLLTLDGLGVGMAAMYDASFNLVGFTNALHPGDIVNLFGSGIGPSPDSDQNLIAAPTNLLNSLNVQVTIGGKQAQVTYAGRTIYPGLDQVQVVVPSDVTPGCYLGVAVRTGNIVSNYGTLPVTSSGRTCAEPVLGLTSATIQSAFAKSSLSLGLVSVLKNTTPNPAGGNTVYDRLNGIFFYMTPTSFSGADFSYPSLGSCSTYTWGGQDNGSPGGVGLANALPGTAGAALNITGPNGKMTVPYQNFQYKATIGGNDGTNPALPVFIPPGGGSFTVDDGSGSPVDVGPFSTTLSAGAPPSWSNAGSLASFSRSSPPTISWTGGSAGYHASISGSSAGYGPTGLVGMTFVCQVPSTDGQFTPPPEIMLSLPATAFGGYGGLAVEFYSTPQTFTATGLDFGFLQLYYHQDIGTTYQ